MVNVLDLKEIVHSLTIVDTGKITFEIHRKTNVTVRPEDVLRAVFHISEEEIKKADILKIKHFS